MKSETTPPEPTAGATPPEPTAGATPPEPTVGARTARAPVAWLLLIVALSIVGLGAFIFGSSLDTRHLKLVGGDAPVNAGATDKFDITAHNSPSLAQNPRKPANLVVTNRVDAPAFSCAMHVTYDGGATWQETGIPFPPGEESPPRCFAPDAAFAADGTLHLSFVTLKGRGNVPNAVWVVSSTDGGRSLSTPTLVSGPLAFQVRILADPVMPRRLYLTWLQGAETATLAFTQPGNPIVFARSDDAGSTWLGPVTVSPSGRQRVLAPSLAVGRRGELYLLYLDVGEDVLDYHGAHEGRGGPPYDGAWALVLARSNDGGANWQETVVDNKVVPTQRFIVFFPPYPSLAVDRVSGRIYVGFHDGRSGDPDVWVWASEDGGASFRAPLRVNDTRLGDGSDQYLPKLAVAPGGRLDVLYYDRRADSENRRNEVSLQSSFDGARSFSARLKLSSRSFDSRIGLFSDRDMADLGSRLALVSTQHGAFAVWTDTRSGIPASGKQDLTRAAVDVAGGSPFRAPVRIGGGVLALLGLGILCGRVCRSAARRRAPHRFGPGNSAPAASKSAASKSSGSLQPTGVATSHTGPTGSVRRATRGRDT